MDDVNSLLAKLQRPSSSGQSNISHSQRVASVASPDLTPPQVMASLRDSTNSASNEPPSTHNAPDRTTNLLNLLKFNQSGTMASQNQQNTEGRKSGPSRAVSTDPMSTLVATPTPKSSDATGFTFSAGTGANAQAANPASPLNENPQDLLLSLLNRNAPYTPRETISRSVSVEKTSAFETPGVGTDKTRTRGSTPVKVFGVVDEGASTSFQAPHQSGRGSPFTYVNPFEQLGGSKADKPVSKIEILKPERESNINQTPPTVGKAATPSPLPDGRSKLEALMGIGAQVDGGESVAHAVSQVGETADKQVEEALAKVEKQELVAPKEESKSETAKRSVENVEQIIQEAAKDIKDDLKDEETRATLEANMPKEMAQAFEKTINTFAQGSTKDKLGNADLEDNVVSTKDTTSGVKVFNLPMRPFTSLDIKASTSAATPLRLDIVTKIATLKKEFDQVDRNLASASGHHIVYAMSKGGGFRIVRQDDGSNKQVFRKAENDIFNVSINSSSSSSALKGWETILATGVNGSVYWTKVGISSTDSDDPFDEDFEKQGLVFPPLQQSADDNNTSGAQLKTRAKQSSRHPEFFAIGRGKLIHIIYPVHATTSNYINEKTRLVNSEKFVNDNCLKISTGKAGKDFSFSADDTIIVSLDKAGKLKFWDIRSHVDPGEVPKPGRYRHVETKTPLMTLLTAPQTDKSWATSVQFVDKERPMMKGTALRYLLVGLKQNHTLQLWDLGLGKPVQELNFPHDNETDPICSIVYHPKSAIIVVGHPTRNSIYLIHLSAPRYNLPSISQAKYIEKLAANDKTLPRPESTAIMSGIREISLSSLGELRSLDVLNHTTSPVERKDDEDTIIEVYLMHSRGVDCLHIQGQDLGWGKDGKVIDALDAQDEGLVSVRDLQLGSAATESSDTGKTDRVLPVEVQDTVVNAGLVKTPAADSHPSPAKPSIAQPKIHPQAEPIAGITTNGDHKTNADEKKKSKKKAVEDTIDVIPKNDSYASAVQRAVVSDLTQVEKPLPIASSIVAQDAVSVTSQSREAIPNVSVKVPPLIPETSMGHDLPKGLSENMAIVEGNSLSSAFSEIVGDQFNHLYKQLKDDKRVQDAAGGAKQEAILRLVSSTLNDNVENNLKKIINTGIKESVLPAVQASTSSGVSETVRTTLLQNLNLAVGPALERTMQNPEILRLISDLISHKVADDVGNTLSSTLLHSLVPNFQDIANDAAHSMVEKVESVFAEQLRQAEMQNQHANAKIDDLTSLTHELLEGIRSMAGEQNQLQQEVLKLQLQLEQQGEVSASSATGNQRVEATSVVETDEELVEIMELFSQGQHEEGTIKWLQSGRQVEFFDKVFVHYNPNYLRDVNMIVVLSVAAAVTSSLDNFLGERLRWLDIALECADIEDPDVTEVAPRIMDVIMRRLQESYMALSDSEPSNANLPLMVALVNKARALKIRSVGS